MNKPNYLKFISYMQIICIILVVIGHSFHQYPDDAQGKSLLIYRMMHSFRMPTFIFVSGFLMAYTTMLRPDHKAPSFGTFLLNKLKRLIIPYLTLNFVTFLPRIILNNFADEEFELSVGQFFRTFYLPEHLIIPYFWFIQTTFVLLIFSYALFSFLRLRSYKHISYILLLTIIFLLLPLTELSNISVFSLNATLDYSIFFITGIAYAVFMSKIDGVVQWHNIATLLVFAILWAIAFFMTEGSDYIIFCQFFGICMMISFSHILENKGIDIFDHLSGCNYIIFLLSWYFNVFSQQIMSKIVTLPWWTYTILSILSGIYGPCLFYVYMKSNKERNIIKCASFLLGQKL